MNAKLLKNVVQSLHFLSQYLDDARNLYEKRIKDNLLTNEMHTELHKVSQEILNNMKVLANRLKNFDYKDDWLNKVAHGYSHSQNFSLHYFYLGGDYLCNCCDAPPLYGTKIINTFNPEETINEKIERIDIVLYLQQ